MVCCTYLESRPGEIPGEGSIPLISVMDKQELLSIIRQALEEDFKSPEKTFQRMVKDGLIDSEGQPVERERRLIFSDRLKESD